MNRVFHFSGGKTSAYMVIHYYEPGDLVLFCDTGREHPKTYKFIHDFEAFENIPVTKISYPGGFEALNQKRKAVANRFKRFCTLELKKRTARRYIKSLGWKGYVQFIGFRSDERSRVEGYRHEWKTVETVFPLYDDKVNKAVVNSYWSKKPYTLEIPSILGNCTLCFNKGKSAIISILMAEPELATPWINDEKTYGHTYLDGISMEQMLAISQNGLFKDYPLENINPQFNCACTA